MTEIPNRIISHVRCILGESPLWDVQRQILYWLDIDGKTCYALDYRTGKETAQPLPQAAGCVLLCEDGGLLFAMEDGIYDSRMQLVHPPFSVSGARFNDGAVAPDGSLIVGTVAKNGDGMLYRITHNDVQVLFEGISCSNGIDFSPDGKTMYYVDTPTLKVLAYDYPSLEGERLVLDVPAAFGRPDGLCVDRSGDLYVALWGGGGLLHIRDGSFFIEKLELGVKNSTCPAFFGPAMDILAVTSAMCGDEANPDSGKLFALDGISVGKPVYRFHNRRSDA